MLTDVYDRLWQDTTTRASERRALLVEVSRGQVQLTGHVTTQRYRQHAVDLVRGVRGVRAIHNALVADPDLAVAVSQALATDARTGPVVIRVGASHGWILLAGEVPDAATRRAAEEVSAGVPEVRGVLGLPQVAHGAPSDPAKGRALQPRVGQAVFATDGRAGLVKQVVIDPRSRLVSHIVVGGAPQVNWVPRPGAWLVPIGAVLQSNDGSVFLSDSVGMLVARRAHDGAELALPAAHWRLPFPYEATEVAWLAGPVPLAPPLPIDDLLALNELSHLLPHTTVGAPLEVAAA